LLDSVESLILEWLMALDPADLILALLLLLVGWLAVKIDGDWGGGKRARVPAS
jgi:hypothetical protein